MAGPLRSAILVVHSNGVLNPVPVGQCRLTFGEQRAVKLLNKWEPSKSNACASSGSFSEALDIIAADGKYLNAGFLRSVKGLRCGVVARLRCDRVLFGLPPPRLVKEGGLESTVPVSPNRNHKPGIYPLRYWCWRILTGERSVWSGGMG
jgi:hypothetical protein